MYQIISFAEPERWERAYAQSPRKDAYYLHAYAELCWCMGDGDPYLFAYEDRAGNRVSYAFIRRPLRALPFAQEARLEGEWYDIITPTYGYGGPLCVEPREQVLRAFRAEFEEYCRSANIVSEFVRFHPMLSNYRLLGDMMDIVYDRETIFIDLTRSEEEILARLHGNHQRNIRKAQRHGLEFRVLDARESLEQLEVFYRLYRATMDKLHSLPYFYFSLDYLKRLFTRFGEGAVIGAVFLDGRMISGALCLREGDTLIYHLGASEKALLALGMNVFQFYQLALWGKRNGLSAFYMGGGHRGRDSLFQFKHRFNPDGVRVLNNGKKVHQPQVYARLVECWKRYHAQELPESYFPEYRTRPAVRVAVPSPGVGPVPRPNTLITRAQRPPEPPLPMTE